MTNDDLDQIDADLKRRADSLWSMLAGDSELFEQLRAALTELRARARRFDDAVAPSQLGFASVAGPDESSHANPIQN